MTLLFMLSIFFPIQQLAYYWVEPIIIFKASNPTAYLEEKKTYFLNQLS